MAESFDMQEIINDMTHRIKSLTKESRELKSLEKKIALQTEAKQKVFKKELAFLNTELDEVQTTITQSLAFISTLGNELKRTIRKSEFEQVKETIDNFNFPELLRRSELKKDFAHYAKE